MDAFLSVRVRRFLEQSFYKFGIHCTTHRIRILLISCVVITSLFYPALALYSSAQPHFLARYSSRLAGSLGPVGRAHDLQELWAPHAALRARNDHDARTRCGNELTLRAERVLAEPDPTSPHGVLSAPLLERLAGLETSIHHQLADADVDCLPRADGRGCLVLSPLSFWKHEPGRLRGLSDDALIRTLSLSANTTLAGFPLTPAMVLADRELDDTDPSDTRLDYAGAAVLTFFFPEGGDCASDAGHNAWLGVLERAVGDANTNLLHVGRTSPRLVALEYDSFVKKTGGISIITVCIYIAYAGFFVWFQGTVRGMHAVHSRIGLAATGLIELVVSTITSLSVCALAGFKITMVPWGLFPIIIVFVGAENMFALVSAVMRTSITLPVQQRIAEGLSRAGASNTLKVVSYNAILGVIAGCTRGATRQFCALAVVVLVAHWFLVHTFFIAVLSIDIQRLELDDLLRQNTSRVSSPKNDRTRPISPRPKTAWSRFFVGVRDLLKGRASRNLSLLLLLAISGTLHYATYPATPKGADPGSTTRPRLRLSDNANRTEHIPAANVWQTLNPTHHSLMHIRLEEPSIVSFRAPAASDTPPPTPSRLPARTLRLFMRLIKLVVLPIALTTTVLYALLLHLLKGQDILEAHRAAEGESRSPAPLDVRVTLGTLPRRFASDVELLATSANGRVVAAVGLHSELVVWRTETGTHTNIARPGAGPAGTLTALALDDGGKHLAVGTAAGTVSIWALSETDALPLPRMANDNASSPVTDLQFLRNAVPLAPPLPGRGSRRSSSAGLTTLAVVVAHRDGMVRKWEYQPLPTPTLIRPAMLDAVMKCVLVRVVEDNLVLAGFVMDDGSLQLRSAAPSDHLQEDLCLQAGRPTDPVSLVHAAMVAVGGTQRLVLAAATVGGSLSLWDCGTGEHIASMPDDVGPGASHLLVAPLARRACKACEEPVGDLLSVTLALRSTVVVFRLLPGANGTASVCRCSRSTRAADEAAWHALVAPRPRSGSGSTSRARSRANSFVSAIPVSGHGIHSRRASDKDAQRRGGSTLGGDPGDSPPMPMVLLTPTPRPLAGGYFDRSVVWQDALLEHAAHGDFERGACTALGSRILGLRRRSRGLLDKVSVPREVGGALGAAALERWELWMYDPLVGRIQASPLADLVPADADHDPASPAGAGNGTNRHAPPRLPFTRVSAFAGSRTGALAGLGNTVALFSLSWRSPSS